MPRPVWPTRSIDCGVRRSPTWPSSRAPGSTGRCRPASGQSLDLETQIVWDDDRRRTLYVTLNAWALDNKAEVAHDEFALTTDDHGGVVGPVRRREAAEHTAAGREGRRLSGVIAFAVVWVAFGWAVAAKNDFSASATVFAWANTVIWIALLGIALKRWQNARQR